VPAKSLPGTWGNVEGASSRSAPLRVRRSAGLIAAALAAVGEALLDHTDPRAAPQRFMTAGAELQANDRSFCEAATATSRAHLAIRAAGDRLARAAEGLAARPRQAGVLRADVTGGDIVRLLSAPTLIAAPIIAARPDPWRRYLHLLLDGLRPEAAHELPAAAPTSQDFTEAATR
jgi:hypothetical protein